MMPNKKNPCAAELVRGKSGRVIGALVSVLVMLKGLPLAYNRDLQEDKEPLFDAVDTVTQSLDVMTQLMLGIEFRPQRMRAAVEESYASATALADYLVLKGVPFREAHRCVGRLVAFAEQDHRRLDELSLEELRSFAPQFEADVRERLTPDGAMAALTVAGGTAPARVDEALEAAHTLLGSVAAEVASR
jgi:argininosuccinate lyase